jgi:hypothetical protein
VDITYEVGAQWSFADHSGDFAPGAGTTLERGSQTDVQFTLSGLVAGAARQSAKFDLGANRARLLALMAAIEFFSAPTSGGSVAFYIGWSPIATAANGNPGGLSGSDGAYDGGASMTLSEGLLQIDYVGSLIVGNGAIVQISPSSLIVPSHRYGILVGVNNTSVTLAATDGIETHVVLDEIRDDVAAS